MKEGVRTWREGGQGVGVKKGDRGLGEGDRAWREGNKAWREGDRVWGRGTGYGGAYLHVIFYSEYPFLTYSSLIKTY